MFYWKQENQSATCFLRARLFTYAISIKHRILATFNKKSKKINLSYCMPLNSNGQQINSHGQQLNCDGQQLNIDG